jgi:hypothetical protein
MWWTPIWHEFTSAGQIGVRTFGRCAGRSGAGGCDIQWYLSWAMYRSEADRPGQDPPSQAISRR